MSCNNELLSEIRYTIRRLGIQLDKAWDTLIDYRKENGFTNDYLEDRVIELEEDLDYWKTKYVNLGGNEDDLY